MDIMPLEAVFFNAIPEAIVLIYLGLALIGIKPDKRRILLAGVIQGFVCYYVRRNYDFGIHIVIQYFSFVMLTWLLVKIPILASFLSNFIAFVIAIILEGFSNILFSYIIGLTITEIMSRDWLRVIWAMPYLIILIGTTYLVDKYKFTLEDDVKVIKKITQK